MESTNGRAENDRESLSKGEPIVLAAAVLLTAVWCALGAEHTDSAASALE